MSNNQFPEEIEIYNVEKQSDILMEYIKTLGVPSEGKLRALIVNYAMAREAQLVMKERNKINMAINKIDRVAPFIDRDLINWVKGYFVEALQENK